MLEIADIAPDFTLPRDGDGDITLSALKGAPVVLFFYPRDDTAGCTKEAVEFTALIPEFEAAGVRVFGVSKDSVAKHDKFRNKHQLGMALLSDEHGSTCEDYGVWKEKSMYGKTFMGIERTTYLIGADGRIAQIWRKVKVPDHAAAVLTAAREL